MFFLVVFGHIGFITAQVLTNIWLSTWSSDVPVNGTADMDLTEYRLGVYGGLGAMQGTIKTLLLLQYIWLVPSI